MPGGIRIAIFEFLAVFAHSAKMQVAFWAMVISPLVVLLVGFSLPAAAGTGPFDLISISVREQIRSALPWVAGVVFLRCLWMLWEVYQRERHRLEFL